MIKEMILFWIYASLMPLVFTAFAECPVHVLYLQEFAKLYAGVGFFMVATILISKKILKGNELWT